MMHTGVFATPEEKTELLSLLKAAQNTPVILVGGIDLAGNAVERVRRRTHEIALAHGLPEVEGYYGCDLENGEFVSV
jgi:hypothetical protein